MPATPTLLPLGIVLSEDLLRNEYVAILAAFVAINTIVYVTLAVAKVLPKLYLSDLVEGRNRRGETRSIHPEDAPSPTPSGTDGDAG